MGSYRAFGRGFFIMVRHHFARLRRAEVRPQIGAFTTSPMHESHVSSESALRQIVCAFPLRARATIHHSLGVAG
jgi:hypothetical protein